MNVQALFDRYNRRYWRGRLPRYTVLITDRYSGGRCEKRERTIYINPSTLPVIRRTLLHEMAHAAIRIGHGGLWLGELKRLILLGAPLKTELALYAPGRPMSLAGILGEFNDAGFEADDSVSWPQVRRTLGYVNQLVDKNGRAGDRRSARILEKARREWVRGRAKRASLAR